MGKSKRRKNFNISKRENIQRNRRNRYTPVEIRNEYSKLFNDNNEKLTRDTFDIAKPTNGLSLAQDLRNRHPFEFDSQGRKFRNVDGSLAMTEYKTEPVKKKTILLLGVMFIALLILVRLLFVDVDINVSKYFSLIKFW